MLAACYTDFNDAVITDQIRKKEVSSILQLVPGNKIEALVPPTKPFVWPSVLPCVDRRIVVQAGVLVPRHAMLGLRV